MTTATTQCDICGDPVEVVDGKAPEYCTNCDVAVMAYSEAYPSCDICGESSLEQGNPHGIERYYDDMECRECRENRQADEASRDAFFSRFFGYSDPDAKQTNTLLETIEELVKDFHAGRPLGECSPQVIRFVEQLQGAPV